MWKNFEGVTLYIPNIKFQTYYKNIIIMSIDNGICWSFKGYETPGIEDYIWIHDDAPKYIDFLLQEGTCIFFFSKDINSIGTCDILQKYLKNEVFAIICPSMVKAYNYIKNNIYKFPFDFKTIHNNEIYIYPPDNLKNNTIIKYYNWDDASFFNDKFTDYLNNSIHKRMIILMGSPLCGKTTYASKLESLGFYTFNECDTNKVKIGDINSVNKLNDLIDRSVKGVIIDGTNEKKIYREIFIDISKRKNIKYIIAWITKSGYYYNNQQSLKVPELCFEIYSKSLEIPFNEKYIRIV